MLITHTSKDIHDIHMHIITYIYAYRQIEKEKSLMTHNVNISKYVEKFISTPRKQNHSNLCTLTKKKNSIMIPWTRIQPMQVHL